MRSKKRSVIITLCIFFAAALFCVNMYSNDAKATETKTLDLNGDKVINMSDIMLLATVFNVTTGDSRYIDAYDLNEDGAINMSDIMIVATKFNTILSDNTPVPTSTPSETLPPTIRPNKIVALTFDDGPDTQLTPLVLDKLDKYHVPATFMLIGQKINDSTSSVIKRIINSGCELGNHTWDHPDMTSLSEAAIKKSVDDTTAAILKYSNTTPKFFRPPYLSTSTAMFNAIDMPFVGGVSAYDWDPNVNAQTRANYILSGVSDGSIILLHDVQPLPHPTPEALDIIIPTLQNRGYEFVTLSELFKRKGVAINPADTKLYFTVP